MKEAKQRKCKIVYSQPFYVDPGYHFTVDAYPNGVGKRDTGYLGVFLRAVEGVYDSQIKWPFLRPFTIEVIDQQPNGTDIVDASSPPYGNALTKPNSVACGAWSIASHGQLGSLCYIKDDAILIRVTVHE